MTKVALRRKPISGGRQSLYLDYYPAIRNPKTGSVTRREFLRLFLYDDVEHEEQQYIDNRGKSQKRIVPIMDKSGKVKKLRLNPIQRKHNLETEGQAEAIKGARQIAIQRGDYGFIAKEKLDGDFVAYFEGLVKKRGGSNHENWKSALNHLKRFTGGILTFRELDATTIEGFKSYLLSASSFRNGESKLSQNSAHSYFNKIKAALRIAYKEGLLSTDLNARINAIKPEETQRSYLSQEELICLAKTECSNLILKKAGLFSALTGLRFSDLEKLVWGEVHFSYEQGYFLQYRQKKTKNWEVLNINDEAFSLLGERREPEEQVFDGLKYSAYNNMQLQKWVHDAGIMRPFTFHCFRHTYATIQLSSGTDIYTVSKLLGHKGLKNTEVYVKIIDAKKREAATRIRLS